MAEIPPEERLRKLAELLRTLDLAASEALEIREKPVYVGISKLIKMTTNRIGTVGQKVGDKMGQEWPEDSKKDEDYLFTNGD